MGFKFLSKIAVALGIALVIVVLLEFVLLISYVKETDADILPNAEESSISYDGINNHVTTVHEAVPSKRKSEPEREQINYKPTKRIFTSLSSNIHISSVICGERSVEATTMLKSTTLFTNRTIQFHVVAEDNLHSELKNIFREWSSVKSGQVLLKLYSLHFPPGENAEVWKRLFKPCAAQRLFLLDVLHSVDSVLYLDTDVLMLRPVQNLWDHFNHFDDKQLASMAPEGEEKALSWYPRFARHPFYGKNGMNSGVMLMNLTRMREFDWTKKILEAYHKYKLSITWGDQDLLNIVFHDHPELLYTYTCDWNYRPDHCMYGNNCGPASNKGISVVHGNRGVYHNDKQLFFKAIYMAMKDFKPGDDRKLLLKSLEGNLNAVSDPYCGAMTESILKYPRLFLD